MLEFLQSPSLLEKPQAAGPRTDSSLGISPESWLFASSSRVRLARFPISAGIAPEMLLLPRRRSERLVRFPIEDGISPVIPVPSSDLKIENLRKGQSYTLTIRFNAQSSPGAGALQQEMAS